MDIQFVCLANSRKLSNQCIAGIRLDTGEWVRPVSATRDGAITQEECLLNDGNSPTILDIIGISVILKRPTVYQPENWVVSDKEWKIIKRVKRRDAYKFLKGVINTKIDLLVRNNSDRIPSVSLEANPIRESLCLIEPNEIKWKIKNNIRGNRQTRALFEFGNMTYDLGVTDPIWESRLYQLNLDNGVYSCADVKVKAGDKILLTISLGEPYQGDCYKLVPAVICLPN